MPGYIVRIAEKGVYMNGPKTEDLLKTINNQYVFINVIGQRVYSLKKESPNLKISDAITKASDELIHNEFKYNL